MNPRPELRIHYLEGAGLMRSRVAHVVVLVLVGAFLLAAAAPASNPPTGDYDVMACGFINVLPQDYSGSLVVTTSAGEASLPSTPAQGLQFSAAVPADNQRDESEPLMEIDKSGHVYTCGPTGFSNA